MGLTTPLWIILFVALMQSAVAQDLKELAVQPGGALILSVGSPYYGNNVTLRTAHLPFGAQKSWIDFETVLPGGRLNSYFIYVHNVTGTVFGKTITETSTDVMLQIWRPVDVLTHSYQLVWSKTVTVSVDSPSGIFYGYATPDRFTVMKGDRIGWTNKDTFGAISFKYVEGHKTYFRKVDNNQYPTVNNEYRFDNIHLPSIFSVAVQIGHGSDGADTPTTEVTTTTDIIKETNLTPVQVQKDVQELVAQPGGALILSVGSSHYGNNVTLRSAHLPSGAPKSFIDFETVLPGGRLNRYFIYVHYVTGLTITETSTVVMLQIWRPVDILARLPHTYQLVWSQTVTVSLDSPSGIFYEYATPDMFTVMKGDRIGWTNEGNFGSISSQYWEGHKTYFRKVENNQYPTVNNEYTFDNILLPPRVFSVAVQIGQGSNGADTPTTEVSTTTDIFKESNSTPSPYPPPFPPPYRKTYLRRP